MGAYLSLSGSGSGREVGWGGGVLIRGWALRNFFCLQDGRLFEMGAFSNKYGIQLLKVAKFYRRLYGGGHKLAPHQTNVCTFSQLARQRPFY